LLLNPLLRRTIVESVGLYTGLRFTCCPMVPPDSTWEPFRTAAKEPSLDHIDGAGGSMAVVRILVVDDLEPWRRFVSSTLQGQADLEVISGVSDGLEAVQKAEELQPDLIVLDIGLPNLNGIEAARRIRKLVPKSKILFLSQESSDDVVHEAFSLGARGYVVKIQAGSELLAAVETVLQGKQFVSKGLAAQEFAEATAEPRARLEGYRLSVDASRDGLFCVEMDSPMPVDLPEDEQIRHIIRDSYIADCNDSQAKMYGLNSAQDLIGKRMTDMVLPDDPDNIELTRAFIRSGYRVTRRESHEVDSQGKAKVFLNSMTGVVVDGKLVLTWGVQSDITGQA
jgi:DNA-binding NarL/FixJ family response regulator